MMMKYGLCAVLLVAFSGCMGGGTGTFNLLLSDEPNAIGDFTHLNATITGVRIHGAGGDNSSGWQSLTPKVSRVDLTALVGANETTLVDGTLAAGKYTKVDLAIADVEGTLKNGHTVAVEVPSGRLFLEHPFTVGKGTTVTFVFDITVVRTGVPLSEQYQLKPNAGDSGPR